MTADRLTGAFRGTTVESCPAELGELCYHWRLTVVGAMTWKPVDSPPFTWYEDLIVTDADGVAPLYMYITGGTGFPGSYACPWYRSFQDALDAKLAGEADCIPI